VSTHCWYGSFVELGLGDYSCGSVGIAAWRKEIVIIV
jgi:hypothetical protein